MLVFKQTLGCRITRHVWQSLLVRKTAKVGFFTFFSFQEYTFHLPRAEHSQMLLCRHSAQLCNAISSWPRQSPLVSPDQQQNSTRKPELVSQTAQSPHGFQIWQLLIWTKVDKSNSCWESANVWQREFRTKAALSLDSRGVRALSAVTTYRSTRECFEEVPELNHPPWELGATVPGTGFDQGQPSLCETTPRFSQWATAPSRHFGCGHPALEHKSLTARKWMGCSTASYKAAQAHQFSSTQPPLARQCCGQTVPSTLCKRCIPVPKPKACFIHGLLLS